MKNNSVSKALKRAAAVFTALCMALILLNVPQAHAAKVKLSRKRLTLTIGEKYRLKVRNTKRKASWSSSDRKIASVTRKGTVKAKRMGTCKIYAYVKGKKKTCRVVVNPRNYTRAQVNSMIAEASSAASTGNYKTAMQDYDTLYNATGEKKYSTRSKEVQEAWTNAVIAKAEEYLSKYQFDLADGAMNEAFYNVSDVYVARINAEKERIKSYRPVNLTDIPVSHNERGKIDESWKDSLGQKGHTGIEFRYIFVGSDIGQSHYATTEYFLNNQYDTFNSKISLDLYSRDTKANIKYNFYSDGRLIYTTQTFTGGTLPFDISFGVTGTTILKIECVVYSDDYGRADSGVIDATLSKSYKPQ